ncbi:ADP-ribosylglycohydrolase family protein [Allochromatium palmeri]|uniref:ADP-ribosylglycohydrolase family protein n=1 Tax=Allochromatium palmeri TaxID=231048 RepID=A0A6N8EG68_9GAMM|nr:ADP-ribosylglycohydrolase family protein [Allochromatium palmeri]MTW22540.1 ADP-ribosylglycohydrolase family protein [Allochromatium palmeri]
MPDPSIPDRTAIVGCLLGTAVGDALGLPYEGLSPQRAARLLGPPERQRLLGRWGLVSDDTEHTAMVAQALIASSGDPERFRRSLAWRLRWWFLGLPAGVGWATLRAILRLWIGIRPERSGVYSAGNGPAMRAAILGVTIADPESLRVLVRASARLTHTDPLAEQGAWAVAWAARMAGAGPVDPVRYLAEVRTSLGTEGQTLTTLIERAVDSVNQGESNEAFAQGLGLARGVSGYVCHTVPVALHAWLSHPRDYRAAVGAVIRCGGDTDSTAAIVGGILGAAVGRSGIPDDWLNGVIEWPRSIAWLERLGERLAASRTPVTSVRPLPLFVPAVLIRNAFFLLVVLAHGFRRLGPPY